jgi:hypothetical protein
MILSFFTLSFTNQENALSSKLLIKVSANNKFTGALVVSTNQEAINKSTTYYFILPFIANNFRTNNPLIEVSNKTRDGMTFVFLLITPNNTSSSLQVDFDIEPLYKDATDFYVQELDRRANFMIIRLAGDDENQNTLYLRYNTINIGDSYEALAPFTDNMLYPSEIEIRFPDGQTRFSGTGDSTNILDKDNRYPGTKEEFTFTAPIEFFSSTYLWINYNFVSPIPPTSTLLAIFVGIISTFSMATFSVPEEFLSKKFRMILATLGVGVATVLIIIGFYRYGYSYLLSNLTELLLALPIYLISIIIVGYNIVPVLQEILRKRKK